MKDTEISRIRNLFICREDAYGLEVSGHGSIVKEKLTDDLIRSHLEGKKRIGVLFVGTDQKVISFCIDSDEESIEKVAKIQHEFEERLNVFPYIEKSKSKGYHLWCFFDSPLPASDVRFAIRDVLKKIGIDERGLEINPKQDRIQPNDGYGNFVYLPLHGGSVKEARTLFVNPSQNYAPYRDQLEFLEQIRCSASENITDYIEKNRLINQPETRVEPLSCPPENHVDEDIPSSQRSDVSNFLKEHDVKFTLKRQNGLNIYQLEECPFRENHTTGDGKGHSSIIQNPDGMITFHCFHKHCKDKHWEDVKQRLSNSESPDQPDDVSSSKDGNIIVRSAREHLLHRSTRPDYLIDQMLIQGVIGVISAPSKAGKSWMALNLAFSIATGKDFLGSKVPHPKPVLYIQEELPPFIIDERLEKLRRHYGPAPDNLFIATQQRVKATNLKEVGKIKALVESHRPTLLILDTWSKICPGVDELKGDQVRPIFSMLREEISIPLGVSILIIHHHGHGNPEYQREFKTRGSTAFADESQFYAQFWRKNQKESLYHLKSILTYAPEPPELLIYLDRDTGVWEVAGEETSGLTVEQVIGTIGPKGIWKKDLIRQLTSSDKEADNIRKALDRLLKQIPGYINSEKKGREVFLKLSEKGLRTYNATFESILDGQEDLKEIELSGTDANQQLDIPETFPDIP